MCTRIVGAAVLTFAVSVVAARFCFAEDVWAGKVKEAVEAAEKYNYQDLKRLSSELENGGAPAAKAILIHLRQGSSASVRLLVPLLLRMKDPTVVPSLQDLLRGTSADGRCSIIRTLFSCAKTDARLLPFWRKALDNDVPYVVLVAAAACREHGDESGLEKMLGALTTTLSTEAVECLKKHKFEREDLILAWVLKCLAAPNNRTPMQVAVNHHDERITRALLKLARQENGDRRNALDTLALIGDAGTLEPLISIMKAKPTKESINAVTRFGSAEAVEALLDVLARRDVQNSEWLSDYVHDRLAELTGKWIKANEPDAWREWWAANKESFIELVNCPEAKRAWELLPSLEDPKTKAQAAEELVRLGPPAAPALARKLMDIHIVYGERWEMKAQIEAAKILTKLGNTGIEYLFTAVTQTHRPVLWQVLHQAEPRKAIEFAASDPKEYSYFIGTARHPEQGPVVRKVMQQMKGESTWGFLAKTLVKAEGAGSAQFLADLARDKGAHKNVRLAAYTELQKLNPKLAASIVDKDFAAEFSGDIKDLRVIAQSARTAGAIGELADDENRTDAERVAAVIALSEGKRPGAAEKLRTFLHSKDPDARLAAINAIGRTDPASAVKELIEIASAGPDPDCRVAAIEALGASRRPEALPVLMKLLHEPDSAEHAVDALDVFSGLDYAGENRLEEATKLYDAWARKVGTLAAQGKDAAGEAVTQAVRNAAKVNPAPFPASLQPMLLFVYARLDFEFQTADRSSVTFPIATQACCFSSDGAKAAFSWLPSPTGRSIVIMDMKTRQARALPSDAYAAALAFSPDASSLAELCVKGDAYNSSILLRVIPIDAPQPKTLVNFHDSDDNDLPPDTCSIAWLDNRRLVLRTVDNDGMTIELINAIDGTRSKLFNSEQIAARWPSLPMPRGDDYEPLTFLDRLSISGKGEVWFCWEGRIFKMLPDLKTIFPVAASRKIFYSRARAGGDQGRFIAEAYGDRLETQVAAVFEPDLANCRFLAITDQDSPISTTWFTDGRHLAASGGSKIVLATADGTRKTTIALRRGNTCYRLMAASSDTLVVFCGTTAWTINVSKQLEGLDAIPVQQMKYPDLSTPDAAIVTLLEAMRRGDLKSVRRACTTRMFEFLLEDIEDPDDPQSEEACVAVLHQLAIIEGDFLKAKPTIEIDGNRATLSYGRKDEEGFLQIYANKVGNEWKISAERE